MEKQSVVLMKLSVTFLIISVPLYINIIVPINDYVIVGDLLAGQLVVWVDEKIYLGRIIWCQSIWGSTT